jgi:hypothetical protein
MRSCDFEAVVFGDPDDCPIELCVECLPEGVDVEDERVSPIFADQEWDRTVVCDKCGTEHDYMNITDAREEGVEEDDGE